MLFCDKWGEWRFSLWFLALTIATQNVLITNPFRPTLSKPPNTIMPLVQAILHQIWGWIGWVLGGGWRGKSIALCIFGSLNFATKSWFYGFATPQWTDIVCLHNFSASLLHGESACAAKTSTLARIGNLKEQENNKRPWGAVHHSHIEILLTEAMNFLLGGGMAKLIPILEILIPNLML